MTAYMPEGGTYAPPARSPPLTLERLRNIAFCARVSILLTVTSPQAHGFQSGVQVESRTTAVNAQNTPSPCSIVIDSRKMSGARKTTTTG